MCNCNKLHWVRTPIPERGIMGDIAVISYVIIFWYSTDFTRASCPRGDKYPLISQCFCFLGVAPQYIFFPWHFVHLFHHPSWTHVKRALENMPFLVLPTFLSVPLNQLYQGLPLIWSNELHFYLSQCNLDFSYMQ